MNLGLGENYSLIWLTMELSKFTHQNSTDNYKILMDHVLINVQVILTKILLIRNV
jgi:hypothetical protein